MKERDYLGGLGIDGRKKIKMDRKNKLWGVGWMHQGDDGGSRHL
jgi:hypothetical protein